MTPAGDPDQAGGGPLRWLETGLDNLRYVMVVPVVLLLVAAVGAFVYAGVVLVDATRRIVAHPFPVGRNIGLFVLVVDLLLIGATLLIAALGFYELFVVRRDERRQASLLPGWLVMTDLNDLKVRVVSMIVLVSAVSFTEVVVDFESGLDVLYLGAGVALVVGALTLFNRFSGLGHP